MKLEPGTIIAIPLLNNFGYMYAKYVDLSKIWKGTTFPDAINVYSVCTPQPLDLPQLSLTNYLLSPMLVAGLRPTLKNGYWKIIGKTSLLSTDLDKASFKGGNSSYEEIELGQWFLYKEGKLSSKEKSSYNEVRFLQPFTAIATGNIEIRLTMYYLILQKKQVQDIFDLSNDKFRWNYKQVVDSPMLPQAD